MSSVVKNKEWNKIFTVSTEGPCNCKCLGCGTPRLYKPRPLKSIVEDIGQGAAAGYEVIEIIGGEPTIHPNFFYLFKKAGKLFKEVYLTTNGITLANRDFAKRTLSLVDGVNITLYGHNALLHEAWTRKKGSFRETVRGIKNCLEFRPDLVLITHLIWRKNLPKLKDLVKFDLKLGVRRIDFLNIQPVGMAKPLYEKLCVGLKELSEFGLDFIDLLDNFESVEIEDYPYCIFSKEIWKKTKHNVHIVDISGQIFVDGSGQINCYDLFVVHDGGFGLDSTLKTLKNIEPIKAKFNNYRRYLKACKGCIFVNRCNGIFSQYIKSFGQEKVEREIKQIRKKHGLFFL